MFQVTHYRFHYFCLIYKLKTLRRFFVSYIDPDSGLSTFQHHSLNFPTQYWRTRPRERSVRSIRSRLASKDSLAANLPRGFGECPLLYMCQIPPPWPPSPPAHLIPPHTGRFVWMNWSSSSNLITAFFAVLFCLSPLTRHLISMLIDDFHHHHYHRHWKLSSKLVRTTTGKEHRTFCHPEVCNQQIVVGSDNPLIENNFSSELWQCKKKKARPKLGETKVGFEESSLGRISSLSWKIIFPPRSLAHRKHSLTSRMIRWEGGFSHPRAQDSFSERKNGNVRERERKVKCFRSLLILIKVERVWERTHSHDSRALLTNTW